MTALKGWHRGERAIQQKLQYDDVMSMAYTMISPDLPYQHRTFHTTRLPFVPVTTLDSQGRPWGSIFVGKEGKSGFIRSPSNTSLIMDIHLWDGDPFFENSKLFDPRKDKPVLLAGIGIEFETRRRNKFAGLISRLDRKDLSFKLEIQVNQAIGNCPKYINIRDLMPHPQTSPKITYNHLNVPPSDRLPKDIITFIHESDTVFMGTSYQATSAAEARKFPSHLGMNHRGGPPGFIRVRPSDGRTLVLPDYSGNRLMTSLGNIEATPFASLTFISFSTGSILYLTGIARTLVGPDAHKLMSRQNTLTTITVTGYTLVNDALPVRQRPKTPVIPSPYSPPVRYLVEEISQTNTTLFDDVKQVSATLTKIQLHTPTLATFTWTSSSPLRIKPGQAVIMDFTPVLGAQEYAHMAPQKPTSINDDRIRTWTVSSSHLHGETNEFRLTMREKQGGAVTGALFSIARKLREVKPEMMEETRELHLVVKVVGVSGEFVLPDATSPSLSSSPLRETKKLLWVAGGIGATPFLSMLAALMESRTTAVRRWEISFVLSTREPKVMMSLISDALRGIEGRDDIHLNLHVLSNEPCPQLTPSLPTKNLFLRGHSGRIPRTFWRDLRLDVRGTEVYVCGPESFENDILDGLEEAGVERTGVRREGFGY